MIDPRYTFNDMADARPLRVPEGLFVLRYVSSPDGLDAPEISVSVPPGSDIAVIDSADSFVRRGETVLGMPGDAVVLKSRREGAVLITVLSPGGRGRRQAHVGLERVTNAPRPSVGSFPQGAAPSLDIDPNDALEIMAHVAHRGDVTAKAGQWICGPQFPMAIEGIALSWRHPSHDLDIVTTGVFNDRSGRTQLPPAPSGRFVGTRGRSAPLVGLSLSLAGPLASRYTLSCEALFLGAAIVSRVGATIELKGPTGHEPLVGLRLSVVPAVPMTIAAPVRNAVAQPFYEASHQPYEVAQQAVRLGQDPAVSSLDDVLPAKIGVAGSAGRVRVFRTSRSRSAMN
ncbi:hypothetical protein [Bosea sp. (in: a-proteobacteria)]|uniref:hypothetical protein n=1 Tax=Bosea sp. (in: a-proteobacteria) TaxID=1871050 RepID=UPI0027342A7F|nr:hypothetical protein [Bosea sp. (in: a-proteobacteria)]MDP3255220.1 hypothetical protein [Bosea sp. (in: a-proteobacteria)]